MTEKTLEIHSENILPIIKKWLYTDKEIFLRELISNACDALSKLKILRDRGETEFKDEELKITIKLDSEKNTLTITDTGIGMTADEVEKYIAQLAFSGAEEFVKKYQNEESEIIGHFGLGFYSSFMVSKKVTIDTLSFKKEAKPAFWSCDGSATYEIKGGKRETRGTEITLHLDETEFSEESAVKTILTKYCSFLPYPIFLDEKQINEKEPLWIKAPGDCTDQDYLDFYRHLHPMAPEPMFWIHLNVDYPFHLQGILYFPKLSKTVAPNETPIQLYQNRVFVSDTCKDILPDYLTILHGVIDSPDIPLNVSRSNLQLDRTVKSLSNHIAKKVTDKLSHLKTHDLEKYQAIWPDIEVILKLGILQDEKFYDKAKDLLIFKQTDGSWTNLEEMGEGTHIYTMGVQADSGLFKKPLIQLTCQLDTPLISFLESKLTNTKFQRSDGGLDPTMLDSEREKSLLDADGKSESAKIAETIGALLSGEEQLTIEAKSLASEELPAIVILDENARRLRDTFAMRGEIPPDFIKKRTLVINTNHPLTNALIEEKDEKRAKDLAYTLYELALLSQKELAAEKLQELIKRTTRLLTP